MSPTPRSAPIDVLPVGGGDVELTAHSYCPRANACATKPINPVELLGAMTAIEQFWVEILKLP